MVNQLVVEDIPAYFKLLEVVALILYLVSKFDYTSSKDFEVVS